MAPSKRQKVADHHEEDETMHLGESADGGSDLEGSFDSQDDSQDEHSPDTEDEIAGAKFSKSKKTLKRKRRATDAVRFGTTLKSLLDTDAPSTLPLSLKPSVARKRYDEKLEQKGKKVLQIEKKDKEDKGRIRDVIGGWGGERERALRKVAQRGVVKLFNAIQQSQAASAAAAEEVKGLRGSGKPTLPAPAIESKSKAKKKGKLKDDRLGGKNTAPAQDDFLDLIRSGGIVSKA